MEPHSQPLNILLAEDNRGDVALVEMALKEHQIRHTLHVISDGAAALDFIKRMGKPDGPPCPDLLLLDINLPKVDGTELLSEFRRHPDCLHTPVITISSSVAPQEQARLRELHVTRYFQKPMDYQAFLELGQVVKEVMHKPGDR